MSNSKYTYLFPYEKVPKGSRIFIYGAGDVGQEYLLQMLLTKYCKVLGFVDRAYDKYPGMLIPIYPVERITETAFDYIVLAFKMGAHVRAVRKKIISMGISEEQIVYVEPRGHFDVVTGDALSYGKRAYNFAFKRNGISVALKYGAMLGDAIVKKKLFTELVKLMPDCHIDIYSPTAETIIYPLYHDQKNLNAAIEDGGVLYTKYMEQYSLSISVSVMIKIDSFNYKALAAYSDYAADQMNLLQVSLEKYHLYDTEVHNRFAHMHRMKYLGLNYYTYPNFTGVFQINNTHVEIPLETSCTQEYKLLHLPRKFITINYGGGISSSSMNNGIAKEWPYEYLVEFVRLFKAKYPGINVIQLGSAETLCVNGVDCCLLGKSLELVKYVLRDSMLHIDKEGGLVHLATQLGTRCVVCFGPTQEEFFGYTENINIKAGKCHGCYCLYDGLDVCARGMERPECMWSITPQIVMKNVEKALCCIDMQETAMEDGQIEVKNI